jgi:DNA-binding FadR family transcriptional regulator
VTEPLHRLDPSAEAGKRAFKQHVAIVKAIENGDSSAAEAQMLEHLSYLETQSRP